MPRDVRTYLFHMQRAATKLSAFTSGKQFADYERDEVLRSAVERQFEILGEALGQLEKLDADLAAQFTEHRRIIGFRNLLIHGYADVDDQLVWERLQTKLPVLRGEIEALLSDMQTRGEDLG